MFALWVSSEGNMTESKWWEPGMENPATWTEAEKVIDKALDKYYDDIRSPEPLCGLSLPNAIANALRDAGLLNE